MLISQKDSSLEKTIVKSYPLIIRYCLSITRNHWDAEDLAHDTIEKILNKYQHLEESNVSKALLYKIASNQWIDNMRKKKRSSENVIMESNFTGISLDQTLENLDSLMNRLTPKQTVAVVLKDVFLYKIGEIASSLKTNEVAIKSLLNRARKNLKSKSENEKQDNSEYWKEVDLEEFQSLLFSAVKFEEVAAMEELIDRVAAKQAPVVDIIQSSVQQVPHMQPSNRFENKTAINRVSCYRNIA